MASLSLAVPTDDKLLGGTFGSEEKNGKLGEQCHSRTGSTRRRSR